MDLLSDNDDEGETTDNDTLIHNMSDGSYSIDTADKASLESSSGNTGSGSGGGNSIGKDSHGKESRVSSGNSRLVIQLW